MSGKRVCWFVVVLALIATALPSIAQIQLGKAWQDDWYPRVRTYPNHTASGADFAVDFYFTERNHADLYMNGEVPLANGLAGVPILSAHDGSTYILLYDITGLGNGNFPWIDTERVIAGLDPFPRQSFSFADSIGNVRNVDMEFVVDAGAWRTLYAHLQIDDQLFGTTDMDTLMRQAISDLWSNTAPDCGSRQRVAVSLDAWFPTGTLLGTSNNWGIATDEHLHFQVFDGTTFPPCLGTAVNLADANVVTLAGQTILDLTLLVNVLGNCEGGECWYYPAMVRQEFSLNDNIKVSSFWDGGTAVNLRESPGGTLIEALPNGTSGVLLSGPAVAALPDETHYIWWECAFEIGSGWVAAEYLIHNDQTLGEIVAWGRCYAYGCGTPLSNFDFINVSAASWFGYGLKNNGSIVPFWERCETYPPSCNIPLPNEDFIAVDGGGDFALGLKSDGHIEAWGDNNYGQCNIPEPNADFASIAAGSYHSAGLKSDGHIETWGRNDYGQCNIPLPNSDYVAIGGGGWGHTLALKSDGSIVAWGINDSSQCNLPTPNNGFTAVSAGGYHSLALKADGTIVTWGANYHGQCNIPEPNADFVAVAGAGYHSLALKADSSIVAWGRNDYGQCEVPGSNSNFVAIAGGGWFSVALKNPIPPSNVSNETNQTTSQLSLTIGPNPTLNSIRAKFFLPISSEVRVNFYDISGRLFPISLTRYLESGEHILIFPSQNLANGIYFCVMRAGNISTKRSFAVLR